MNKERYCNIRCKSLENMRKYCAEDTIAECKAEIDRLLLVLNMKSNAPSEWAKLDKE